MQSNEVQRNDTRAKEALECTKVTYQGDCKGYTTDPDILKNISELEGYTTETVPFEWELFLRDGGRGYCIPVGHGDVNCTTKGLWMSVQKDFAKVKAVTAKLGGTEPGENDSGEFGIIQSTLGASRSQSSVGVINMPYVAGADSPAVPLPCLRVQYPKGVGYTSIRGLMKITRNNPRYFYWKIEFVPGMQWEDGGLVGYDPTENPKALWMTQNLREQFKEDYPDAFPAQSQNQSQ